MKKLFLILPLLALFSCESSDIDLIQDEEIIPVVEDELIVSVSNPNVLERIEFRYRVKTDGLPMNQLYDSIKFSVSGIDEELRVYNIAFEDPGNPYGNPAEIAIGNWYHHFITAGNYQARLYGYKNNEKKTLDVVDFTVTQPYDFYNIDWNNYVIGKKSYFNEINRIRLITDVKTVGNYINLKPAAEVTYGFDDENWPYSESKNEEAKAILYSNIVGTYSLPTYAEQDNLNDLFAQNFTANLPENEFIHNIWITEKNIIALLDVRTSDGTTLNYKLYAEKR